MDGIVVATRSALLIARRASAWTVDEHLNGQSPGCLAIDPYDPTRVYCGTAREGLFRSIDSGRNWKPVGSGIDHPMVTAVDVARAAHVRRLLPRFPLSTPPPRRRWTRLLRLNMR